MTPTDFDTSNSQKSIMDITTSFITDTETTVFVQPRKSTLNNPPVHSKTASILCASLSQKGLNTLSTKLLAMRFAKRASDRLVKSTKAENP